MVKNPPASAGDVRDVGSIPGWGRSPGEGNGNPLQYSCLENPMDREDRRATVHGVTKSQAQLGKQHFHFSPPKSQDILSSSNPLIFFFQLNFHLSSVTRSILMMALIYREHLSSSIEKIGSSGMNCLHFPLPSIRNQQPPCFFISS